MSVLWTYTDLWSVQCGQLSWNVSKCIHFAIAAHCFTVHQYLLVNCDYNHSLSSNTDYPDRCLCISRVIFRVVLRRMVFNSRRFGTLCLFHLHRRVDIRSDLKQNLETPSTQTERKETAKNKTIASHLPPLSILPNLHQSLASTTRYCLLPQPRLCLSVPVSTP
jgi:hypothetical protein